MVEMEAYGADISGNFSLTCSQKTKIHSFRSYKRKNLLYLLGNRGISQFNSNFSVYRRAYLGIEDFFKKRKTDHWPVSCLAKGALLTLFSILNATEGTDPP